MTAVWVFSKTPFVVLQVLQSELPEGLKKLEAALEKAEKACSFADDEEKEIIEQEVAMLQEEFDIHNDTLQKTKTLLEVTFNQNNIFIFHLIY